MTTGGFTITYARANGLGARDATAVQWSTDLANWSSTGVTTTVIGQPDTTHETVDATVPTSGTRVFVRIIVEDQ